MTEKNKKSKLLIATDNFLPRVDGISIFLSKMLPKLIEKYDVTVVTPNFGKYPSEGYSVLRFPLRKKGMGDYVPAKWAGKKIKKLVKKSDIVFTQTIGPVGASALIHAKKQKKPVATFMHSIEWELIPMATKTPILRRILYPFTKYYARYIYRKSDLVFFPSDGIAEIASWERIGNKKKIVHLGVDSNVFKPLKDSLEKDKKIVSQLQIKYDLEGKFIVGTHGRLAREKDLYTLLRAYNWLQKKVPEARLIILGEGVPEIERKLRAMKGVILPGAKEDVHNYLKLMDVYVTASLTETTSLATLEAMSTGLPIISTAVGFIKEYIKDNVNGFFFPKGDAYALFKAIDLLKNNKALAKTVGERARKTVENRFQWSQTIKGILEGLESLE